MTRDDRFKESYKPDEKGGVKNMCEVLNRENWGLEKGCKDGILSDLRSLISTIERVITELDIPEEKREEYHNLLEGELNHSPSAWKTAGLLIHARRAQKVKYPSAVPYCRDGQIFFGSGAQSQNRLI